MIAKHAVDIGRKEGMTVEINAAEAIAESCGNDIRQVLNCLHMWSSKRSGGRDTKPVPITYRDIKEREMYIQKDELLRVSIFDATKLIVEGCRGVNLNSDRKSLNDSFFKRSDAFFTVRVGIKFTSTLQI